MRYSRKNKEKVFAFRLQTFGWQILGVIFLLIFSASYQTVQAQISGEVVLTEAEKNWISEHPVIRATNKRKGAPIDFVQEGKPAGFSIDYLNLVAQNIGIKVDYVNGYDWQELLVQLKERKIDVTHSLPLIPALHEHLTFTKTYLNSQRVYYGQKGAKPIRYVNDFVGKKIGLVKGTPIATSYKTKFLQINLVEFDTLKQALTELSEGNVDVVTSGFQISNYTISQNSIPNIEVIGPDIFVDTINDLRLAFRNDWPMLGPILEKGMSAITEAEVKALKDKWQINFLDDNELALTQKEINWLSQNKTIRVVANPFIAPTEFIDENNQISGVSGAYLSKIGQKLNIEFVWAENQNWSEGLEKINARQAEVISAVVPTPERLNSFIFTNPYLDLTNVIYAREDSFPVASLEGSRIALISDFAISDFIRQNYSGLEIVEVKSISEALNLLSSSEVDVYIGNIPTTAYYIALGGHSNIVVVGETPYKTTIAMGIRNDIPLLASAMQKSLQSITQIENTEILSQWLFLNTEKAVDYRLILQITGAVFLSMFLIIAVFWVRGMRREIVRRTLYEKELLLARNEAQAAGEAKSRFLANMSHEIRTPMNAILGFTDLILLDQRLLTEHRKNLEIVSRSGAHLLSLINDVLDMSKIEAEQLQLILSDFEPGLIFQDLELLFQVQMADKGLEFIVEIEDTVPDMLKSDKRRLRQILINLIGNALKFTKEGGIYVSGRTELNANEELIFFIDIRDTGCGILAKDQERVFEAFEQTDEGITQGHGTGLGLPLSRYLARELGGDITITSEYGSGATFHVTLCVEEVSAIANYHPIANNIIIGIKRQQSVPRVLIADDVEENRHYLQTMLKGVGLKTKTCVNGKEAVNFSTTWSPDIILMDAKMPVMDGREAIIKIRADEDTKDIPIIVVSASILEGDVKEVLNVGANSFLAKPVERHELLIAIQQQISLEFEYRQDKSEIQLGQDINGNDKLAPVSEILPSELIQKLQEAAVALNVFEMELLIKDVLKIDKHLGENISRLLDEFEWDELNRFLELKTS